MRALSLLTLLLLPIAVTAAPEADEWSLWNASDETNTTQFDHALWQTLLDEYVASSDDGINRVAYARLAETDGRARLQRYIAQLAAQDPRALNRAEQMAYWINLYNAVTIEVVLKYPRKGSILRMGEKLFSIGPWNDKVVEIAGEALTLNDIEHRILRPIWQDHRIHFAVNCASIGCPNLSTEAYRSDNLETLLTAAEVEYINHPRGASINQRGKLTLSSIFDWYGIDFADTEAGVVSYVATHHKDYADDLAEYDSSVKYDYDWGLNSQTAR